MKKICLIGGSGILGRYYASQLSKEYEIHVADIGLKDKKKSSSFYTYHLDLQSEAKIKNFFEKNKKRRFDILINNAAFTTEMAMKIQDTKQKSDFFSSEIFDKTINVNLKGIFLCCKYFIKFHHNKSIDQRVINVGTIYSMHSPHHEIYNNESFFSSISYSASKAGVVGMTKWLATKFAEENTNFNIISPAGVFNNHSSDFVNKYVKLIPKKKMATQKQIYAAIKFLISKDADYVVGQNLYIDGGFTSW